MVKEEALAKRKGLRIFDYTIWRILAYFIVYSFLGFVIETLFGLFTQGILESRKSNLYGPFCCIYGLGAVCLICQPQKVKSNNFLLFISGIIIGSIVEYTISWAGEAIFQVKWWDYSNYPFNINGRICVLYSIFWGILTLILNKSINPQIDKVIAKIPTKICNKIVAIITIFLIVDALLTSFALKMFFTRITYDYKLDVQGVENYYAEYLDIYQNHKEVKEIVDKMFSNYKMLRTFPNLRLTLKSGEIIQVKDIIKDVQPYYIKVFEKK